MSGCGAVRGRAHLLPACHVVAYNETKTSIKCHVMMFVLLPVPVGSAMDMTPC